MPNIVVKFGGSNFRNKQNISDWNYREAINRKVFQQLEELERYLLGINYIGEVPDFLEDLVLSYGER